MAPVREGAEGATGGTGRLQIATPSGLTTTHHDLITALQAVVGLDGDTLVVTMVVDLLRSGRLTWGGKCTSASGRGTRRCLHGSSARHGPLRHSLAGRRHA